MTNHMAMLTSRKFPLAWVLGGIAMTITLVRLWLGDPRSLTEVLWAEDGYFPSCVRVRGASECMTESFAGYYLLVPRLGALVIAPVPLQWWPVFSVLLAALLMGVTAGVTYSALLVAGQSRRVSALSALVLAVMPLFGLEVVGVLASAYVPLLVASTVFVVFVTPSRRSGVGIAVWLSVTALTMPAAAVLLPVLAIRAALRDLRFRVAAGWAVSISVGLAVQLIVALVAPDGRGLEVTRSALRTWVDGVVNSVLSVVPGLSWSQLDFTPLFALRAPWYGPWLVVALVLAVAVVLVVKIRGSSGGMDSSWLRVGLLVLAGLGLSLFPSLAGTMSYRYFVAPVALWLIALLVAVDPWMQRISRGALAGVLLLIGLLWAPSFAASDVRSSPAPSWQVELDRAKDVCAGSARGEVEVIFTPVWPGDNKRETLQTPLINCRDVVDAN